MKRHSVFAGSACLLLILSGAASAEVNDLADLVPANTLAYLELHDPPRLARELHALVKGSYLQHPASLFAHHTRQRNKGNEEAFLLAWFCSPEFIDELGEWEGGCLALTGFTRSDNPIITGVLRTGRSRMVPLALRMALAASGEVHCIGRVEGVPLFQIGDAEQRKRPEIARRMENPAAPLARLFRARRSSITYRIALIEDMPVEEPEEKPEFGCFLALMPGVIAAGSTPEILSDTIRRLRDKSVDPSLATVPAFRGAAALRNRPGLFAWVDPPRLTRLLNDGVRRELIRRQDEIRQRPLAKGEKPNPAKRAAEIREAEAQHRRETQEWTFFQTLVNPTAMRYAAAGLSLCGGEFSSIVEVRMKDKRTSPLLDVLPSERIGADLLRAVPGDAFCLFCLPLPDGPSALTRLLKLADAYAAAGDDKTPPPSKTLRELETRLKMHLSRDVLAKIRSAGVAVHLVGQPEKGAGLYPVIVVEAVSDDAATDLEAVLPRLYGAGLRAAEPKRYTIQGQVVRSFTNVAADPNREGPPSHYGRRGKLLVLGWHRGRVAATLRDSAVKKDLLNLPRGLATVDAEGPVSALGLFSCRQLLSHFAHIGSRADNQDAEHLRALRYLREMGTPMATMPPTLFSVKRLADGMRVEFRQSELPSASATVVDISLTWLLDVKAIEAALITIAGSSWFPLAAPPPQWIVPAMPPAAPVPPAAPAGPPLPPS